MCYLKVSLVALAVALWPMAPIEVGAQGPQSRPDAVRVRGMIGVPQALALCARSPHSNFLFSMRGFYYHYPSLGPNGAVGGDGEMFPTTNLPYPLFAGGRDASKWGTSHGGLHVLTLRPVLRRFGRIWNGEWVHVHGVLHCGWKPPGLKSDSWWRTVSPAGRD
jgi:hypothetical protein